MAQPRTKSGVPAGGQFGHQRHEDPGTDVLTSDVSAVDGAVECSECGAPTKRSSGMCRKCDPDSKSNKGGKSRKRPGPVAGVERVRKSGPIYDTDADPVTEDQIGQCSFEFVPVYRNGEREDGGMRPCKNAVVLPAERCHQHGGAQETSLGRSMAKATAEAGRGECFPLAAEHWEQADERLAAAEGRLFGMLETNTDDMAKLLVEFRRQQGESGVGRFSVMNQMLVLQQHAYGTRCFEGTAEEKAAKLEAILLKAGEPHMTAKNWAVHGREVTDGEGGVAVVWWQPGHSKAKQDEGESDDDYQARLQEPGNRGWRGKHGALMQYPLSATEGDDYEVVDSPIGSARPSGFGDPEAAVSSLEGVARDMGIDVKYVDSKPSHGYAYWQADTSEIVVWSGIAGGDRRAVAHSLAHELGHARLGHSTKGQVEDHGPEKEMAAESFAALTCAHHGIDSSELSAYYVKDWAQAQHIRPGAGGLAPMRSAVAAFDDYVTALG